MNIITATRKRLVRSAVLTVTAGTLLTVIGAGPADATTWNNGQLTTSSTYCDYNSRLIQVSAYASQMSNYTNGQSIRYRIFTQDVNSGVTYLSANWSAWVPINGNVPAGGVLTEGWVTQPKLLGTTNLYGARGHGYRVVVQYDWWTGQDSTGYDPNMIYTEKYSGWTQTYTNCWF